MTTPNPEPHYLQRRTPLYRRANLALFAAGFTTFSSIYAVQPLMPAFSHEFQVSATVSSLSLSATTLVLAFTLFVAGLVSASLVRKKIMGWSLLATALLSLLVAAAPGWHALLVARLLQGVALGGVPALAIAYLSEEVRPQDLGSAMGLYIAGTAIGGISGRVMSGVLAEFYGWRLALVVLAVIGLLAALVFWWLLPPSRNFVARRNMSWREHASPLLQHLRHPALPLVFACGFLLMGVFVTVYNYIAYRLSAAPFSLGQAAIGSVFLVYALGIVVSPLAGRAADRWGRPPVLLVGLGFSLLGLLAMWPQQLFWVVVGIGLVTLGFFIGHVAASGWVGLLAKEGRGHAAGFYLLAYYLGLSLMGTLGGVFWEAYGWGGVSGMVLLMLLLMLLLVLRLARWQAIIVEEP